MKDKEIQLFSVKHALNTIDQGLLRQAFTHSSMGKNNNERLEFLGDAVLGCIIAQALYQKLPDAKEHYLTRLRAHLVNKNALAALAKELDLSSLMILGQGERQTGGKQRDSILADTLEAVIGAIFLSGGYATAQEFVVSIYARALKELPVEDELKDPKTRLQEWLQQRGLPVPDYQIIAESGKPHAKTFTVELAVRASTKAPKATEIRLRAQGKSRRAAEQQVAENVLLQLIEKMNT